MQSAPKESVLKCLDDKTSTSIDLGSTSPCLVRGQTKRPKATWINLFAFTQRTHARVLFAAIVAAGATAALRTALAIILGRVFDIVAERGSGVRSGQSAFDAVRRWCLVLVGLGLGNWLANAAFLAMWILFGELQVANARDRVFQSLLVHELSWFDLLDHGTSGLLVRIQTQTRELQAATSQVLGALICDALTSAASLAVALHYSWRITLVLFASLPISFIALSFATRPLEPAIQAQKTHLEKATQLATASLTAVDLVKVFGGLDKEIRYYRNALGRAAKQYLTQARCNSLQTGYIAFWVVAMFVLGFWYGCILVQDGLPPGQVITTFYATLTAFQSIEALFPHWLVLSKGVAAGSFLSSVTGKPANPRSKASVYAVPPIHPTEHCVGDVLVRNVSFSYPSNPTTTVLDAASFAFPAGQITFIVGKSGSGKSTIGNLISKLYKPSSGQICIDGRPLELLDDTWVRKNVTLIEQSSVLFDDTFFNNIALGHPKPENATAKEVLDACQTALLQSTLMNLPQGIDTWVGPHGFELSGGQKQKISLARARLRNPTILILDEITSGLDEIGRTLVMDALREWRRGKTTIVITHDMCNINDNEYVYVMESARVIREGFKRDLVGLRCNTAREPSTRAVCCPPQTKQAAIRPPASVLSAPSADPIPLSRASQGLSGRFFSNIIHHARPISRSSLVIDPAHSFGMRLENALGNSHSHRLEPGGRATLFFETEKRHFSAFINSRFYPLPEMGSKDNMQGSSGHLETSLDLPFADPSEERHVDYIFGAAERRANIPGLRKRATSMESVKPPRANPESAEKASLLSILATLWPNLRNIERLLLILGIIVCLAEAISIPAFAYCLAQLMSVMWSTGDKAVEGQKWAVRLLVVAIADGLCTGSGRYLMERVGQAWVDGIRRKALSRILQQSKSWFDDTNHLPNRITECLERNSEDMRNIVGRFVPIAVVVFTILSVSLVWALLTSWRLTLVALAPLPFVFATVRGYASAAGELEGKCNVGAESCGAVMAEVAVNIRVVRALTLETHFRRSHHECAERALRLGVSRAKRTSWMYGLYQSMSYALTALVFYYSTKLLAQDAHANVASVVQVVNLLLFGIGTSSELLNSIPQLALSQAAAAPLLKYQNLPPARRSGQGQAAIPTGSLLPIRTHGLNFSYPSRPGEVVLHGVSLEIRPGGCTVIVGPSGCGKSTIASLLLGLRTPPKPSSPATVPALSFAGVSYLDIDLSQLSSTMAYVPQLPFLFPTTIAENIAYGLAEDSPYRRSESLVHAAQAVGLHDFIASLPQNYSTLVGDGGLALSGGQAQRLSIARALARRPQLLVMDEPTSALDSDSSRTVRRTIRRLIQQARTCDMAVVLVTHSRDVMRLADKVIVLSDGIKVDEGSYRALVRKKGPFMDLISGGRWTGDDERDIADCESTKEH